MASVNAVEPIENVRADVLKKGATFSERCKKQQIRYMVENVVYLLFREYVSSQSIYEFGPRLSGVPYFVGFPKRGDKLYIFKFMKKNYVYQAMLV